MYRYPKDQAEKSREFYQNTYREGMTTELPDQSELERLLESNFINTEKDFSERIDLVRRFSRGPNLLDYGCSWGYGLYQFRKAGFNAIGFEISEQRARYGRKKLGMQIISDLQGLEVLRPASFDVVFSDHVLEHLPTPRIAFEVFDRLLTEEGTLLIFVPNCGGVNATRYGVGWGPMIGEKHALALTAKFFAKALQHFNMTAWFFSSPYSGGSLSPGCTDEELSGDELMVIAKRRGQKLQS